MDAVTHPMVGTLLANLIEPRWPYGAILVVASSLPDLDGLGPNYLANHRAWGHSLFTLAALAVGFYFLALLQGWDETKVVLSVVVGFLSHLAGDAFSGHWPLRLLFPLSGVDFNLYHFRLINRRLSLALGLAGAIMGLLFFWLRADQSHLYLAAFSLFLTLLWLVIF